MLPLLLTLHTDSLQYHVLTYGYMAMSRAVQYDRVCHRNRNWLNLYTFEKIVLSTEALLIGYILLLEPRLILHLSNAHQGNTLK